MVEMEEPLNLTSYRCELTDFHARYASVHGWLSLAVCSFGSIANIANIVVLTRKEMRSPTNLVLTGLAFADLLVMIEYIPYTIHLYLYKRSRRDTFTYAWAMFVLFHSNFTQVCHTISISLTLILAIWRYVTVSRAQARSCSYRQTILAVLGAYVVCPILCLPLYITTEVIRNVEILDRNGMTINKTAADRIEMVEGATETSLYFVRLTETARNHGFLNELNFWIYSVVIKLIPCVILTLLSLKLLSVLVKAKRRRRKLIVRSQDHLHSQKTKEKQTDRTTAMLLAVLALFLLTELPQGVLGLLSVILGQGFFNTCYVMLGDVIDVLTLINSAINFILYCSMSRQFRRTFRQLFCQRLGLVVPRRCREERPEKLAERNGGTGTNNTATIVTQKQRILFGFLLRVYNRFIASPREEAAKAREEENRRSR